MDENKPALTVEKLNKSFGSGSARVHAVRDVMFDVEAGSIVLVMGPSGSGKTTLLTMIGSLLSPDSGRVYYGRREITGLSGRALADVRAREVGFIFQSFNLMRSLSVLENVSIVRELLGTPEREAKERARRVLSDLGLSKRLSYSVSDLSGGEKQRVSIARALIADPRLVLADEPTANLDSRSGHHVMELLRSIAKQENKAVVIVSHDTRLFDIADRVLWLEDGVLAEGRRDMVRDPVCEMDLQKADAPYTTRHGGTTYYFCSKKCLQDFNEDGQYEK